MITKKDRRPVLGLALSGGAIRSIAHIGVLQGLEDNGIKIEAIAGTSGGSLVGALYASGEYSVEELKEIALNTRWPDILQLTFPKLGLISSEGIYKFLDRRLKKKHFEEFPIPFASVASDLYSGERVVITKGSVAKAVQASCSLPVVFTPTVIWMYEADGSYRRRVLIDGGYSSQVPIRAVLEDLNARVAIAVNVNINAPEINKPDNLIKIAIHLTVLWSKRNATEEEKLADFVIPVDVQGITLYDLDRAKRLIELGQEAVEAHLKEIKALVKGL